jgi:uncharacterized protein (TIGR00251 family)
VSEVISERPDGVALALYVQPRASRTRIVGLHDGRLKVALAAPPVDGKANKALTVFLAGLLGVSRSSLRLLSGESGRRKTLLVEGRTIQEVRGALVESLGDSENS